MKTFNLDDAIKDPRLLETATFSRTPILEERKSKIKLEEWNVLVKHIKDLAISLFALIAASIFLNICITLLYSPSASADDKKWATSIITLIASGLIGYLTGKSSK